MSWSAEFSSPIPLPKGRSLRTLADARAYVLKLPKAKHDAPEWRTAIEAVLLVGGNGGPTDLARIGLMQALYPRRGDQVFSDRKDPVFRPRKLKRDQ